MEQIDLPGRILRMIKEYRFVILILIIGIFLMLLPQKNEKTADTVPAVTQPEEKVKDLEEELEQLLCQIQGAGRVEVLLTQSAGERILYQTDEDLSSENSRRSDTVLITDAQRNQDGLIRQTLPPTYLGAVILCQGGDNAQVRLALIEAAATATGLSYDKITVLKMK